MAPMTSSPLEQTGRKVEPARPPTSQAGHADPNPGEDGFTLIEMVCVLAIIAALAAIILPALPRGTSRAQLESYAIEMATLLKTDRNAALRRRVAVAANVNAAERTVRA